MNHGFNGCFNPVRLNEVSGGDDAFVIELVETFIDDNNERLANIEAGIRMGDWEGTARLAHGAKGSCANMGAESMREAALLLEQSARSGDPVAVAYSLAEFRRQFQIVRDNDPRKRD